MQAYPFLKAISNQCLIVFMLEAACVIKIRSYLSLLHSSVDVFVLLELLQLCLNQHLSDVHYLLHGQRQTLHGETELLLQ